MLRIATVYPELLGTYGDGGNALVLVQRLRRRGIDADHFRVALGEPLPDADLYLLGGGEDGPQQLATEALRRDDTLARRLADGAHVLAVCAGLQILGTSFSVAGDQRAGESSKEPTSDAAFAEGLGLVDVTSRRGSKRAVGDLLVDVGGNDLVGFENHGGVTQLGRGVQPLGRVQRGAGNGTGFDGFIAGTIIATYAHGPVLALNPWFADFVLERVSGESLGPLASVADDLYALRRRVLRAN